VFAEPRMQGRGSLGGSVSHIGATRGKCEVKGKPAVGKGFTRFNHLAVFGIQRLIKGVPEGRNGWRRGTGGGRRPNVHHS